MGFLDLFFGKNPEKHEQKGDAYAENANWGMAKLEYEKAEEELDPAVPSHYTAGKRLEEKLARSKTALASEHKDTADNLLEQGHDDEARDLLLLALELAQDAELTAAIETCLLKIERKSVAVMLVEGTEYGQSHHPDDQGVPAGLEDEYFTALIGTLPEEAQTAYASYGDTFKTGYLALNRGEFDLAAEYLSRAMAEHPDPASFIPLELATARLNQENFDEARQLLASFLQHHPDALPGYQLLCEVFWATGAFDEAEALLDACPASLRDTLAYFLLRGETLVQAAKHDDAIVFYQDFLVKFGWNDTVAQALAESFESNGDLENARNIYVKIMDGCNTCHSRPDPAIKRKLADISFDLGEYSTSVLEIYLSLAQEDPYHTPYYFDRVSRIYEASGNLFEADRYRSFARQVAQEQQGITEQ